MAEIFKNYRTSKKKLVYFSFFSILYFKRIKSENAVKRETKATIRLNMEVALCRRNRPGSETRSRLTTDRKYNLHVV